MHDHANPEIRQALLSQSAQIRSQEAKLRHQHDIILQQAEHLRKQEEQLTAQDQQLRDKESFIRFDRLRQQEEQLWRQEELIGQQTFQLKRQEEQFQAEHQQQQDHLRHLDDILRQQAEHIRRQDEILRQATVSSVPRAEGVPAQAAGAGQGGSLEAGAWSPQAVSASLTVPAPQASGLPSACQVVPAAATVPAPGAAPRFPPLLLAGEPVMGDGLHSPQLTPNPQAIRPPAVQALTPALRPPPSLAELRGRERLPVETRGLRPPERLQDPCLPRPTIPVVAPPSPLGLLRTPLPAPGHPAGATELASTSPSVPPRQCFAPPPVPMLRPAPPVNAGCAGGHCMACGGHAGQWEHQGLFIGPPMQDVR